MNISNILFVTMKPPTILTVERVVAAAPKKLTDGFVLCASKCIPPKAVDPEIAFVTASSFETK